MRVRVISLNNPVRLVATLKRLFPQSEVDVQRGIDVRKVDVSHLHDANLITHGAAHVLRNGRKWHHELSSKGAVGLAHANRMALLDRPEEPLLLLEDDAHIKDEGAFVRAVHMLLDRQHLFDMAVFGVQANDTQSAAGMPSEWKSIYGMFHLMHAVLYTPPGRRIIGEYLRAHPLEMQIDSLCGSLARQGTIRAIGTCGIVVQRTHLSSIQESMGSCILCDVNARTPFTVVVALAAAAGLAAVLAVPAGKAYRRRPCRV